MIPLSVKPRAVFQRQSTDELVVGLDVLATSEATADHMLAEMIPLLIDAGAQRLYAATHRVSVFGKSHVAMSISLAGRIGRTRALDLVADALAVDDGAAGALWTGDVGTGLPSLQQSARTAAAEHRERTGGRVVHFPGVETLTGRVSVRAVLESGIDRIHWPDGDLLPSDALLIDGPVRPRWRGGELMLHVQRAGRVWVPAPDPCPARL